MSSNLLVPIKIIVTVVTLAAITTIGLWLIGLVAGAYWFFLRQGFLFTLNYLSDLFWWWS